MHRQVNIGAIFNFTVSLKKNLIMQKYFKKLGYVRF